MRTYFDVGWVAFEWGCQQQGGYSASVKVLFRLHADLCFYLQSGKKAEVPVAKSEKAKEVARKSAQAWADTRRGQYDGHGNYADGLGPQRFANMWPGWADFGAYRG